MLDGILDLARFAGSGGFTAIESFAGEGIEVNRVVPRADCRRPDEHFEDFLNLVISGAVTGAIYSIMASGLVLTYPTSGIFNFAHGAVAFVTAYLYFQLNTGQGVPDRARR